MAKLTVLVDGALVEDVDALAAGAGVTRSDMVRRLLAEAMLARNERTYASVCREAVRQELDSWLCSARIQKEWAADDFYDRLCCAFASELRGVRALAGAALHASLMLLDPDRRQEAYEASLEAGPFVGIAPFFDGIEDYAEIFEDGGDDD